MRRRKAPRTRPFRRHNPRAHPALSGPDIHHYGEPVAFVVARTFEQARAAASLVEVDYAAEPGQYDFAARLDQAYAPKRVKGFEYIR